MTTVPQALDLAVRYHQAGHLQQAAQLYQQILHGAPQQVDALHLLGLIYHQVGQYDLASAFISQALQLEPSYAEAHQNLGNALLEQGKLAEAVASFQQALRLKPSYAKAHHNLGNALLLLGKLGEAVASYRQALRLEPNCAETHHNLGNALRAQGQLAEAVASFQQALRLEPNCAEAHNNLGVALSDQGKLTEAVACFQQALRLKPSYGEAHNNLGVALRDQGHLNEAVASYQQALRLEPNCADAHNNLGVALSEQGKLEEALASYQQALRLEPNFVDAHNNLGNALRGQGKLEEALACYRQALRLEPNCVDAYSNQGVALGEQGKRAEALASYQQALRLDPNYADAHNNLGNVLGEQGQLAEAVACYQQALRLRPGYADAHNNLGMSWLLLGNFEQGWPAYEWRGKCKQSRPPFAQPLWDGSPLVGQTILLHPEQGLGDTLQFIRYASLVKERGGRVLVVCQPALVQLLTTCPGLEQLHPEGRPLPPFDVQASLLSLPGILGTSLATVPAHVPYLVAEAERIEHWGRELNQVAGFKIGIAWQGNPKYQRDRLRSIPLAHFEPLARLEGVRLVSLQKGHGSEQLQQVAERFAVLDLGSRLDERGGAFLDTAAVLQHLDLVITSDTALAHLAGALAVPVWVALPFVPDWRWLLKREDSPWYPTMRLFRQTEEGNWPGVFARLAEAVQQRLRDGKATQLLPLALPALSL